MQHCNYRCGCMLAYVPFGIRSVIISMAAALALADLRHMILITDSKHKWDSLYLKGIRHVQLCLQYLVLQAQICIRAAVTTREQTVRQGLVKIRINGKCLIGSRQHDYSTTLCLR